MKNFHQNLLILLALALCGLCIYQWYGQTLQRAQMDGMNRVLSEKLAAIQDYTNSVRIRDGQIAQMDAHINELKSVIKTNDLQLLEQKRQLNNVQAENEALTNQVIQYKQAIADLAGKLKEAYDGVQKQNDAIKQLVAQRNEFVQKLNDSVKERNDIVDKYNKLADVVKKMQSDAGNSSSK